jgi:hypothetical protein
LIVDDKIDDEFGTMFGSAFGGLNKTAPQPPKPIEVAEYAYHRLIFLVLWKSST